LLAVVAGTLVTSCTDYKVLERDGGTGTGGSIVNVTVDAGGSGGRPAIGTDGGGPDVPTDTSAGAGGASGSGGMTTGSVGGMMMMPPAMLAIDPTSKDLSVVVIGRYAEATFQISNPGGAATSLPAVAIDGTDAAQFSITSNACDAAILPGKSCLVTLRFSPDSAGLKTARLGVQATLGGAVTAALQGTGVPPGALTLTPANASLGSVLVNQRGTPTTFTVTNSGGAASGTLATSLSDATEFAITTDGCKGMTLAPMGTCTIAVTFTPTTTGQKSATLSVTATPGGTASSGLTALGLAQAVLSVSPTTGSFPSTTVGSTSAPISFTLSNAGGVAAGTTTALASTLAGSNAGEFAIASNTCTPTLAAGASCAIGVTFTPASAGAKTATLSSSASPGGSPMAALVATGRSRAALALDPATGSALDFGTVAIGDSVAQTFVATNTGGDATSALSIAATGTDFTISAPGAGDCVSGMTMLAAGASCTIHVKLAPSAAGAKTSMLTVTATTGGAASRALTGTAVTRGALTIAPTTANLGSVEQDKVGTAAAFTVTNTGGTATGILATVITGSTEFRVTTDGCQAMPLPAGAKCTISVSFAPASPGQKTGTLSVTATPGGTATAALTGVGLAPAGLGVAPSSFTFPAGTVAGNTSVAQSFTVTNSGGVASGVPTATLAGTDSGQFGITTNGCMAALGAGASCTILVVFKPTSAGAKSAMLSVTATPGGTKSAAISAVALSMAKLRIDPAGGSSVEFPATLMGDNALETFVVTNEGQQASSAIAVAVTGTDFAAVAPASGDCISGTTTLAPAATCTVRVRFTPTAAIGRTGSLSATATTGGPTSIALSGTGVAPGSLKILPVSQVFGAVLPGNRSPDFQFSVSNPGGATTAPLTTAITQSTEFAVSSDGCKGMMLAPSATCNIAVAMVPASAGPKTGTLTVAGGTGVSQSATLTGTGLMPARLTITPNPFMFPAPGTEINTDSGAATFTVSNDGDGTAGLTTVLSATVTGVNAADFIIMPTNCLGTLAARASCTVSVHFIPKATGNRSATLTVNAAPGGPAEATLRGMGLRSAVLSATPATMDFGRLVNGQQTTPARSWIITNTGEVPTTLTLINGNPTEIIPTDGCTGALLGGASCTVGVAFKAFTLGARGGTLTVTPTRGVNATLSVSAVGGYADGQACSLGSDCASNLGCNTFFVDGDGDGHGGNLPARFCTITTPPPNYATVADDCCDLEAAIHPGADFQNSIGVCDKVATWDYDCSGMIETNPADGSCVSTVPPCVGKATPLPVSTCGQTMTLGFCAGPIGPPGSGCSLVGSSPILIGCR